MADPSTTSHHAIAPRAEAGGTVSFTLDGRPVSAAGGQFLIAAAEQAGVFIPRFCYHPRMKPVGMCRMCLVEVSGPHGASLQPACYVPVAEGMEVVTTSDKVRKAQDGVLEFLLVNHPLDCPVCDKGGECPLQDQVLAYGPGESRFLEEKRHWAKPIAVSELVLLDRERCIQCGRCVRFAAEIAGEAQIDFLGRGDEVEVNIFDDHVFSSYFSGNTVQICPVGALTATPYRFAARPWDVDQVESTCTTCALGCRVAVQSSANRVTRLLGIDTDPVNQSWLCDKGRFAFEAVNSEARLVEPLVRRRPDGELESASWGEALGLAAERLGAVRTGRGAKAIGVVGGARLSNEDAYAWAKLAKGVIGTDSVDAQLADGLPAELVLGLPRATIDEACSAACVVTLAGDLREELPVLYLRLRGALVQGDTKLVEVTTRQTALTPYASASLAYRPGEPTAVLRALAGGDSPPESVDSEAWRAATEALGAASDNGAGIVVVLGRPSLAEHQGVVAEAADVLARAWPAATFLPAVRRGNVMGALDMGLAPGLLPGRVVLDDGRAWFDAWWGSVPAERGHDTAGMFEALAGGAMEALVLLGADPLGDFPDRDLAERARAAAGFVLCVDSFHAPTAARADVVLPAAMAHERAGSTTNIEGRVTRLGQKLVAPGQCWADWMIAAELAARLGGDLGVASISELWDEIERVAPSHAGITRAVLDDPAARDGVVVPLAATPVALSRRSSPSPIDPVATPGIEAVERHGAPPRVGRAETPGGEEGQGEKSPPADSGPGRPAMVRWPVPVDAPHVPALDSYSLRLVSGRRLYDGGAVVESSESLAPLVPAVAVRVNPGELDRLGVASGGRVRVRSSRGSLVLDALGDDGVPKGVAAVSFNLEGSEAAGASALIDAAAAVVDVRLETL
ncbi:MAG: NADH-quinone oxidoreductase subunit NuoG [Acidimicrobiales bacterium]